MYTKFFFIGPQKDSKQQDWIIKCQQNQNHKMSAESNVSYYFLVLTCYLASAWQKIQTSISIRKKIDTYM